MMSCGGTSSTTVRSDTLTMRSIGHSTRTRPGPFGLSQNPAETEHDGPLVLGQDVDPPAEQEQACYDQEADKGKSQHMDSGPFYEVPGSPTGSTRRVIPAT